MAADNARPTGAVAARDSGSGSSKPKWLIPLAILLLALIALGIFLLVRNRNDKEDKKGVDVTDDHNSRLAPSVPDIALSGIIRL